MSINNQVNKAHTTAWKILGTIVVVGVILKTVNHVDIFLLALVALVVVFRKPLVKLANHKVDSATKSHKGEQSSLTTKSHS
jgi:hypothetical protein